MATIYAVAGHILAKYESLTTMKLQKLTYFAQAHSLATTGYPLFDADFQAWRAGPVCLDLYKRHAGEFLVSSKTLPEVAGGLTDREIILVDKVCAALGNLTGNQLSDLTHSQDPWLHARKDLPPTARCDTIISKEAIKNYYTKYPVVN